MIINDCTITDNGQEICIVKNHCYANAVGARWFFFKFSQLNFRQLNFNRQLIELKFLCLRNISFQIFYWLIYISFRVIAFSDYFSTTPLTSSQPSLQTLLPHKEDFFSAPKIVTSTRHLNTQVPHQSVSIQKSASRVFVEVTNLC